MSMRDLIGGGITTIVDQQTFTSSGTWTKPANVLPTDLVVVDLWGAGGSGGIRAANSDTQAGGGAGGGGHNEVDFRAGQLNATESVVVGSGGTAASTSSASSVTGNAGGFSEFKGHRAYGGGAGSTLSSDGGSGGGIYSAGISTGGARGGEPQVIAPSNTNSNVDFTSGSAAQWAPGEWGGGGSNSGYFASAGFPLPVHGGAGAKQSATPSNRNSLYGGAAGGAYDGSNAGTQTGGTSTFGGNGGSMAIPASNTSNVNGGNGTAPGGGGSGAKWGSTGTVTSGAGARGEVRITVYRGI